LERGRNFHFYHNYSKYDDNYDNDDGDDDGDHQETQETDFYLGSVLTLHNTEYECSCVLCVRLDTIFYSLSDYSLT
jgi:hypothetical protein